MFYNKSKKIIAYIITFMIISFLLFSSLFIIKNVNHDCVGDDCPICNFIHDIEHVLKNLDSGKAVWSFYLFKILFYFNLITFISYSVLKRTLILEKVRLNN
ncbi:hypothetical protein [Anaerofustis stercorihominis]|uniref:hypothetical protein n=1 Tax=Anaerofustis stercorihominis TaxID=214853 RepID=UPI001106FC1A|nr:hypothetical protein [Anaerofustis stercorihominis]